MGRIRQYIEIEGQRFWTLFDTGAVNTSIVPAVAALVPKVKLAKPYATALGGSTKKARESALLVGKIEGHRFTTHAMVLDKIGKDEEGKEIEVLFGALAMQQWGIRPLPKEEKLDMSHYPETFVEF
jgi:hypothetical protein